MRSILFSKLICKKFNSSLTPISINKNKFIEIIISNTENANLRLDRFISNNYNIHWDTIQKSCRNNEIFLIRQNEKIKVPKEKLILEDKVYILKKIVELIPTETTNKKSVDNLDKDTIKNLEELFYSMIVFQSKELFIINKFYNIACQNGTSLKFSIDTMLNIINSKSSKSNMKLVHRLDKNVSGLMLLGNDIETVRKLGEVIQQSKVEKTYLTVTQNIPIHIKHMLKENKLNVNSAEHFLNTMAGYIKSNDDCDQFTLEMNNRTDFSLDPNTNNFTLNKHKTNNSIDLSNFNMFGKFKISHFIFYDRNKKEFKLFSLSPEEFQMYNFEELDLLKYYLEATMKSYEDETVNFIECYSVVLYELVSGKKHQIRKHMSKCFFTPILNDEDYLFDKTKSKDAFKLFNVEEKKDNDEGNYSNSKVSNLFMDKFKINSYSESIFLQSVKIVFPKLNLTETKINKNLINYSKLEDTVKVQMIKLNENFQKLFKGMKLSKLCDIDNYKI